MTTPTEFVLWLNGAAGVMGDAPEAPLSFLGAISNRIKGAA